MTLHRISALVLLALLARCGDDLRGSAANGGSDAPGRNVRSDVNLDPTRRSQQGARPDEADTPPQTQLG
jgi:hypothetical protein